MEKTIFFVLTLSYQFDIIMYVNHDTQERGKTIMDRIEAKRLSNKKDENGVALCLWCNKKPAQVICWPYTMDEESVIFCSWECLRMEKEFNFNEDGCCVTCGRPY
jgi:hypothetical protein